MTQSCLIIENKTKDERLSLAKTSTAQAHGIELTGTELKGFRFEFKSEDDNSFVLVIMTGSKKHI